MKKKSAKARGKAAAKDLRVGKRPGESVKGGGRITNIRTASGTPSSASVPGQIVAN
jgi:hypothetical protein